MRREEYKIKSELLGKEVKILVYGHFGINVLLFPITDDDPLEFEHIGLIQSLSPLIEKGHIKLFSFETNNLNCWLNNSISPKERSDNHFSFNSFLTNELIQFIYNDNGAAVPIITAGAGIGAFHAVNSYLRRPDIFMGAIGANGFYDIQWLSGSYYDENCYFNSPLHYLPNLTDDYWLSFLKSQNHLSLIVQNGNWDLINQANRLSDILRGKDITHNLEIIDTEKFTAENINNIMLQSVFKKRY